MYNLEIIVWQIMLQWNWSFKSTQKVENNPMWNNKFLQMTYSILHSLILEVQILWLWRNWHLPNNLTWQLHCTGSKELARQYLWSYGWHLRNLRNGPHVGSTVHMWPVNVHGAIREKGNIGSHFLCSFENQVQDNI